MARELATITGVDVHFAAEVLACMNGDMNLAAFHILQHEKIQSSVFPSVYHVAEFKEFSGMNEESCRVFLSECSSLQEARDRFITTLLPPASQGRSAVEDIQAFNCPICDSSEIDVNMFEISECRHIACVDCCRSWIRASETSGGSSSSSSSSSADQATAEPAGMKISCPMGRECRCFFSQPEVRALVGDVEFQRMERRALELAVACNPSLHLCDSPDCTFIYVWTNVAEDGEPVLSCPFCVKRKCILCHRDPYHDGLTCQQAKDRETAAAAAARTSATGAMSAAQADAASAQFIQSNTRTCRRCGVGIEKTHGCDKMKCRCGYKFCYHCGTENAKCSCTPSSHGFWDNATQRGDFSRV